MTGHSGVNDLFGLAHPARTAFSAPVVVGISDMKVLADGAGVLATFSLGSCVALCAWDPLLRVAGMIHCQLPSSRDRASGDEGGFNPAMYMDTGIPLLFRALEKKNVALGRCVWRAAGGAAVFQDRAMLRIGERNIAALRGMLWKAGFMLTAEALGGAVPRTVWAEVDSGRHWIKSRNQTCTW